MWDGLIGICLWLESWGISTWVRNTTVGYPFIRLIHFSGLSLLLGSVTALDLRLLGVVGKSHSIRHWNSQTWPMVWTGFAIAVTGGGLLFSSIAATYIRNPAFQIKIPLLLLTLGYHIWVQRTAPGWDHSGSDRTVSRIAGGLELLLWLGVIIAAVEIPNN